MHCIYRASLHDLAALTLATYTVYENIGASTGEEVVSIDNLASVTKFLRGGGCFYRQFS